MRGRRPPAHYTPAHIAPFAGPRRAGQQGTDGDAGAGAVAAVQDRRQGRRIEGAGLGHCGADSTLDRRSRLQHHTSMLRHHGMTEIGLHAVFRAVVVSRLTYASPAWSAFITATDRQLGILREIPYFRPLLPPPGGRRREEQISRILLVRLSCNSDDTVTQCLF